MTFNWNSIEVRDAPELPRRSVRPPKPRIVQMECANCDAQFGPPLCQRSPYCSLRCHDQADFVRYARAKAAECKAVGVAMADDIRQALRIQLAHALGAGYDTRARRLPDAVRTAVWERDGGRCMLCGGTGKEIDHINGPSAELDNLRLLCRPCHDQVTTAHLRPLTDERVLAERAALIERARAEVPQRVCDAPDWNDHWRAWHREHATYEG